MHLNFRLTAHSCMHNFWTLAGLAFLLSLTMTGTSRADTTVSIPRHAPCNLFFPPEETVQLQTVLRSSKNASGELTITITDYFAKVVSERVVPFKLDAGKELRLSLVEGELPYGYYEVTAKATSTEEGGSRSEVIAKSTFGVAERIRRTAEQVRNGDYRFGMKMFFLSTAWWRGNAKFDEREVTEGMCRLGLQWTRNGFGNTNPDKKPLAPGERSEEITTPELIQEFPINVIMKVERFPRAMYDEQRYGPLEAWEAKFGKGAWVLKTLPKKEPYQQWLRAQLKEIPASQNVFEIWNEPWDKMSPEDFATLSQWIADVVLTERPGAILGPNLLGNMSKYEYDARVIDAGGLKGMKMVALHPYSEAEDRQFLRDYRKWLKEKTGNDLDLYVTEYGAHSTPEGPAKTSETEQARKTIRQSLCLYAEGVKAFTPHWAGQREQNPTYHEDWFGYVRLNHEPKPALMALATAARMIDGSRYVGDLWFGTGVGAMVFERSGTYTLALWTQEGRKTIEVDTATDAVVVVDMAGKPTKMAGGKLTVEVTPDLTYVQGLGKTAVENATTVLDPKRFPHPEKEPKQRRTMPPFASVPAFDGSMDSWKSGLQLSMMNPKVAGDDASGIACLGWDATNLYVAVDMRDNEMLNVKPRAKLYLQDSVELFVSTEARDQGAGYGPKDFQFFAAPVSGEGGPIFGILTDRESGKVEDAAGSRYYGGKTKQGWCAQIAVPWTALGGFKPEVGGKIAVEVRVNDSDSSHERWKIDPLGVKITPSDPSSWSELMLGK